MKKHMRFDTRLMSAAVASLFCVAAPATAQDAGKAGDQVVTVAGTGGKIGGVPFGPMMAYPEVDVTFKSNDNIYSQPASGTRKSANILVVAPKIVLEAKTGPHTFDIGYRVENGSYSGVSSANYTDQALNGNATWVFSGRSGVKLNAEYLLGHDDQGAVPGATNHGRPDKYNQTTLGGLFGYGAEGAQGRIEVDAGVVNKRYDNFKVDNLGNPDNTKRDRDDTRLGATFYWRVMPKTQLLFQATQTRYDYKASSFGVFGAPGSWTAPDSTDRKYLIGVTWEAAAKTTGIFKVGTVKKDFSDSILRDFSGTSWDGTIKWSPLTYSNFDFNTGKSTGESTIANASLDTRYGVTWNHAWNSRLSSVVSYNNTKNEYQGIGGTAQTDKINAFGLQLNYQWIRTVKFGVGYDRTDKTSDVPTSEYKRDIYSIFVNAAI